MSIKNAGVPKMANRGGKRNSRTSSDASVAASVVSSGAKSASPDVLKFAERSFINAQELVRFMDQKAGFLLAGVGILTAALGTFGKDALLNSASAANPVMFRIAAAVTILYVVMAFATIYSAAWVFSASAPKLSKDSHSAGMLFPLIVLSKHNKDEQRYASALTALEAQDIIDDYSNQILEISNIYSEKHARINVSMKLFRASAILWVFALLGVILSKINV